MAQNDFNEIGKQETFEQAINSESIFDFMSIYVAASDYNLTPDDIAKAFSLALGGSQLPVTHPLVVKDWSDEFAALDYYDVDEELVDALKDAITKYASDYRRDKFLSELEQYLEDAISYKAEDLPITKAYLVTDIGRMIMPFKFNHMQYYAITDGKKAIVANSRGDISDEFDDDVILSKKDMPKLVIKPDEVLERFGKPIFDLAMGDVDGIDIFDIPDWQ